MRKPVQKVKPFGCLGSAGCHGYDGRGTHRASGLPQPALPDQPVNPLQPFHEPRLVAQGRRLHLRPQVPANLCQWPVFTRQVIRPSQAGTKPGSMLAARRNVASAGGNCPSCRNGTEAGCFTRAAPTCATVRRAGSAPCVAARRTPACWRIPAWRTARSCRSESRTACGLRRPAGAWPPPPAQAQQQGGV